MDFLLSLSTLLFSFLSSLFLLEAKMSGFTVDLIHHNSRLSPFYNHSATSWDRARNDALHSIARANHFHTTSLDESKIDSPVIPNGGGYLMKIAIGSPPVENLAIADTGSDLVWIQCLPCDNCYAQDDPLFDPSKSSTYQNLPCSSNQCQSLPRNNCGLQNNDECSYTYTYGDQSYTQGFLATDTFTFSDSPSTSQRAEFQNSIFGCGHNNDGTFNSHGSGLVGLGGGPLSLVSQLGTQIDHKFSYCLVPRESNAASKLRFGSDATLSGTSVVSSPLSSGDTNTYYYLTLEAVSVGDKRIDNNNNGETSSGGGSNIIIDSGTTLTILKTNLYNEIEAAVQAAINLDLVQGPRGYNLCYDTSSLNTVPELRMVFHFTGTDVTLKRLNMFRVIGDITCFTIVPSDDISIYGNWAQMNFQVGYDLAEKQISFAPADCTMF